MAFASLTADPVQINVTVDTATDLATVKLTGRSDGWFGVGLGNTTMPGTYGIIVRVNGTVEERTLDYLGGSVLTPELTVLSNTLSGGTRVVEVERARDVGDSSYFAFPDSESTIPLIAASALGVYTYHGSTNRSPSSLELQVPEPASLLLAAPAACVILRRRRG